MRCVSYPPQLGFLHGVQVMYNDERIKIKNFKEYVDLYLASRTTPAPVIHEVSACAAPSRVL